MLRAGAPTTDPSQFDAFFAQIVKEKRAYLDGSAPLLIAAEQQLGVGDDGGMR